MPLLLWAYPSGERVFECLLKNGADPNVILESNYLTDNYMITPGSTLLFLSVKSSAWGRDSRFKNYVALLLRYGANPNLGRPSPLARAASDPAYEEAFQSLIKAEADPNYNAGNDDYLVQSGNLCHPHRLNILLEHGATYDINTLQGAQLQRYLYKAKSNPTEFFAHAMFEQRKEIQKAIDWLEAHGVSFDAPAPLLPEEIEREEKRKKEAETQRRLAEKEAAYQSKLEYASRKARATLNWYQGEDETTFALCQAIAKRDVFATSRVFPLTLPTVNTPYFDRNTDESERQKSELTKTQETSEVGSGETNLATLNGALSVKTEPMRRLHKLRTSVTIHIDPRVYTIQNSQSPQLDPIFNQDSLISVKDFILRQGKTETFSAMYNNNPCWRVNSYVFYLIPDPGGPNNRLQFNAECDPLKTDFHSLMLRNDQWSPDQYLKISFKDSFRIELSVSDPSDDLSVGTIRNRAEESIKTILDDMKRFEE
ncbi:MAG: hypothetical protein J6X44_05590 [Thermoguttaceae bacterium]|nr:hypothetical protein [Thermoguttaceae bacterium]